MVVAYQVKVSDPNIITQRHIRNVQYTEPDANFLADAMTCQSKDWYREKAGQRKCNYGCYDFLQNGYTEVFIKTDSKAFTIFLLFSSPILIGEENGSFTSPL